ncbi:MAG: hypothetical protein RIM72_09080 [Alphaproteobacteria bacterium]
MTGYSIDFAPFIPLWTILVIAGVWALASAFLFWRGVPAAWVRTGVAAVILAGLANPTLHQERREPNADVALLIVDETPSQEIAGRIEQTRAAAEVLRQSLSRHEPGLDVREVILRHDSIAESDRGTTLLEAVRTALADVPDRRYAGSILVTDGQIHDADQLGGLPDGPLHAVLIGDPGIPDRRIRIVEYPSFAIVGEPFEMVIRVDDPTATAGDSIRASLSVDGEAQRLNRIPFNEDVTIEIALQRRGATVVELSVPDLPEELSTRNNTALAAINGVRDRLRVLLISGEPHPGERTWRNLLKSDPSVDLVHFTILRPPEKQDGTPINELSLIAFPTRELFEVKLNDFDLIVFDNYRRRGVLPSVYLANVVDYIYDGGALLDAAGPGFAGPFSLYRSPLGEVLPLEPLDSISEGVFRPMLTERGRRHPVTASLPGGPRSFAGPDDEPRWGAWLRQVDVASRSGDVVMTGLNDQPLLSLDRVGEGRVAQISSDHIWLWARGYEGGGPYAELMRRLSHWLMQEPELEEEDLSAEVRNDRLEIRLRTLDDVGDNLTATVEQPDGTVAQAQLEPLTDGVFSGSLPLTQNGLYEVGLGDRTVRVAAGSLNAREVSDLTSTDRLLAGPVADSGGGLHRFDASDPISVRRVSTDRPTSGSDWVGLRRNGDYTVVGLDSAALLPGWFLLALVAAGLAFAWRREAQ